MQALALLSSQRAQFDIDHALMLCQVRGMTCDVS
jgi:hypothetical protein